jgi:hypothetical protein
MFIIQFLLTTRIKHIFMLIWYIKLQIQSYIENIDNTTTGLNKTIPKQIYEFTANSNHFNILFNKTLQFLVLLHILAVPNIDIWQTCHLFELLMTEAIKFSSVSEVLIIH